VPIRKWYTDDAEPREIYLHDNHLTHAEAVAQREEFAAHEAIVGRRYYEMIDYRYRERFKGLGGRFDGETRYWYVPGDLNVDGLGPWKPIETSQLRKKEKRKNLDRWKVRDRHIYLLIFEDSKTAYVGQSSNPPSRFSDHRHGTFPDRSYWRGVVHSFTGNQAEGWLLEDAWCWRAHLEGYVVPPHPETDSPFFSTEKDRALLTTAESRLIATSLRWPTNSELVYEPVSDRPARRRG